MTGFCVWLALLASTPQFFDTRIAPILSKRCLGCHNDELNDGNISFQNRETLLKGGSHGPAIVPGDPEKSVLIHAVRQDGELKMPPGGQAFQAGDPDAGGMDQARRALGKTACSGARLDKVNRATSVIECAAREQRALLTGKSAFPPSALLRIAYTLMWEGGH